MEIERVIGYVEGLQLACTNEQMKKALNRLLEMLEELKDDPED